MSSSAGDENVLEYEDYEVLEDFYDNQQFPEQQIDDQVRKNNLQNSSGSSYGIS